jgi:hypothetical protein
MRRVEYTFRIKKSLIMVLVNDHAKNSIRGKAANHVKMKPKGSGSCNVQEEGKVNIGTAVLRNGRP